MTPFVIGLVVSAALMHAVWNALLRIGADRLWTIVVMEHDIGDGCVASSVDAPDRPRRPSWPYIGLSVLLEIGYCLFLERAYRDGGLSQVYPIARGTSPLLVTLGAAALTGERLAPAVLVGVAVVSLGYNGAGVRRGSAQREIECGCCRHWSFHRGIHRR